MISSNIIWQSIPKIRFPVNVDLFPKNSSRRPLTFFIIASMLPDDYKNAILKDYRQKFVANILIFEIRQPSPARLKAACKKRHSSKYSRKDDPLLIAFFGESGNQDACLKAIGNCDLDRFKPLGSFIKGKTTNPFDEIVEMVAWLIDFEPRPYDPKIDYSQFPIILPHLPPDQIIEPDPEDPDEDQPSPEPTGTEPEKEKRDNKKIILTITILVTLGMVFYWIWPHKPSSPPVPQKCMYWADDHYEPIDCNQKIENVQVLALDSEQVLHLKKISRPDTITANAIGSVWYVRYRGRYEYFTDSGLYPPDQQYRLRPITPGVIRDHIPAIP